MVNSETLTEMTQRMQVAIASLGKRFPDLFANMSRATITEYSCLVTAIMRAEAANKGDNICEDRLAGKICGEEGAALAEVFSSVPFVNGMEALAYVSLRTYCADFLMKYRDTSIDQIVILGAGIDTRAFRLHELAGCHVFEVDGSKLIQDFKQRRVNELKLPLLAEKRDVLVTDLADPMWWDGLNALGFNPSLPTFWLLEGLVMYLTKQQIEVLLAAIDKLSAPCSELFCDMTGGTAAFHTEAALGEPIHKTEDDYDVLNVISWSNTDVLRRDEELAYSGSLWDAKKLHDYVLTSKDETSYRSFCFSLLKKPTAKSA